jgi:ferredoxin/flavodoxin
MKPNTVKLYYFSGTGNSLKIAKDIGGQIGEHELISMTRLAKLDENIVIDADTVGFIFPVYFARPPVFVREFIEKAVFKDTSYIFAVENGGGLFGRSLKIFEKYINNKGKKLSAGFVVSMPGNHPKIASMQKTGPEEHYAREAIKTAEIAEIIKGKKPHKIETNFGPMGYVLSYLAFKKPYKGSENKELDKAFYVNDNCIGCGTCVKICPVGNISLSQSKPHWKNNCANCLACYHHCAQKAIVMVGEEKHLDRYYHPDIRLEELFSQ